MADSSRSSSPQSENVPVRGPLRVIGLLGGVASGKSLVAQQLQELGAGILDADRAGHEVLGTPEVEAAARERWGATIFDVAGRIDRKRLAALVFAPPPDGPRERKYLEQLTHPAIAARLSQQAQVLAAAGCPAAVLDAPLLLEAGWDRICDTLVFVDAPRAVRLARAQQRGWSQRDFDAREAAQESLDSKQARADVVVDNSGTSEHTQTQITRLWHSLVG